MQEARAVDVAHAALAVDEEHLEHVPEDAGPRAVLPAQLRHRLPDVGTVPVNKPPTKVRGSRKRTGDDPISVADAANAVVHELRPSSPD